MQTRHEHRKGSYLFNIFAGIYVIASQFYIGDSGSLQPSHFLIILLLSLVFVTGRTKNFIENRSIKVNFFAAFVFYSFLVNILWAIFYQDSEFILSTFYYFFNFMFLILFIFIFKFFSKDNIINSIDAALLLSVIMFINGLGRYNFAPRYNGYFNDPNQMGLWILCLTATRMLLKEEIIPSIRTDFAILMSFILSFATDSRSTILGLIFIFSGYLTHRLASSTRFAKAVTIPILIFFAAFAGYQQQMFTEVVSNSFVGQRFSEINVDDDLNERGWYRIIENPEFLLFGAGQGNHFRFNTDVEIHSTWAGIVFYYGLIGFILFFFPFFLMIKNLRMGSKFIVLAPLVYSLSTFSARTPIFWFFIAAAIVATVRQSSAGQK